MSSKYYWKKGEALAVSSWGGSVGLGTLWDSNKFDLIRSTSYIHWIFIEFLQKDTGHKVILFNIYVPALFSERRNCWEQIQDYLTSHLLDNIILARDLNITLSDRGKRGSSKVRDPSREWVEDIISEWDLEDIKPLRGNFTWTNKRLGPGHITARLDRFLVQHSLLLIGLSASSQILSFGASNHKPILLEVTEDGNLCPIPFRYNRAWIDMEGFQELVASVWNFFFLDSPSLSVKRNSVT